MRKKEEIVFEKQFGVLTCYHIAHKDRWEAELNGAKKQLMSADSKDMSDDEEETPPSNKRQKKSKGKGNSTKRGKKRKSRR